MRALSLLWRAFLNRRARLAVRRAKAADALHVKWWPEDRIAALRRLSPDDGHRGEIQ